jgi:CheY-like chemotaxis protein
MGHQVRVARNGLEGLALVSETVPQVVLCDIGLPGMSGLEVCDRVRALPLPLQPLMVALTGWGMTEDRRRTQGVGFDHHLVKPVTADSLLEILRGASEPLTP